jgi:Hom_end-associated Hint/Phage terminase large subunit/LAGLIDADG-like domain
MGEIKIDFDLSPTVGAFVTSDAAVNILISPTGEGKCLAPNTPVLMFDGTIKMVQDIRVGDQLMGDDSTPRTVLSVCSGQDEMFEVVPVKGDSFIVNKPHILSLKKTRERADGAKGETVDLPVAEYLEKTKYFKHLHKLYRVGVEFPGEICPTHPELTPYLLGLWLGDGTNIRPEITTADPEILAFLETQAEIYGLRLEPNSTGNASTSYRFVGPNGGARDQNIIHNQLKALNLFNNKHIPLKYKTAVRQNRLELLAGLIDTDGWINHEGYQIIQKSRQLAEDIVFLARSLGLAAYFQPRTKYIQAIGFSGTYFHVMISGDCSCIPVRLERKKCAPRQQKKDPLVTGIKEIRPLGMGDYHGFTLDGNHRFLLGDFTVTHNTFGAVVALPTHAIRCGKKIQAAIVRDTHENIKTSTARSIEEVFQDYPGILRWRNDYKNLTIRSEIPVEVDLFGIDDLSALSKLQGPQYALIWLEEPAPMADKVNAGLSEEVYNAALLRCARQSGTKPRLQVTMNPASEDHWTFRRFIEEPDVLPDFPLVTKRVWHVPYGENSYLNEAARQFAMVAYKDDPAAYARYVEGKFAPVQTGIAVTPQYRRDRHMILDRNGRACALEPAPGLVSFAFFDSWANPACVLGQITKYNRLVFLDTLRLEQSDIETLLETMVIPMIESPRWQGKSRGWRIGGDCTMLNMDQSTRAMNAARKVEQYFPGSRFEAGPREWKQIEEQIKWVLTHNDFRGESLVLLSGDNKILDRGLAGAWHYPKNNAGERSGVIPVKDKASHPCDAFANAVCRLLPSHIVDKKLQDQYRKANAMMRRRTSGYTTNAGARR